MRRALLAILLLASLAGCASPTAPAQAPVATGQIDGAVVDQLLRPFDGQPVYLMQTGSRDDTSPLGGFTFRNVPAGTYNVLTGREGYRSASAVVEVQADRVTRVILQLLPLPTPDPRVVTEAHDGAEQVAQPGLTCTSCSWSLDIEGRPTEFILEAMWRDTTPLVADDDDLEFEIWDDVGNRLYLNSGHPKAAEPFRIKIAGADLHEDATRLDIVVSFDDDFTTRPRFEMDQVGSFYYGATHDGLFYV